MNSFALYGQSELWLHPRLTMTLGGRFSYVDIDVPVADRGVGAELRLSDLTGSVGLLYHLTPDIHLATNLGRGFRTPNVFDLSTLGSRPGNRFQIPNPSLRPEEVLTRVSLSPSQRREHF
jgi:hemoglobin/transferrin/lactoferrin receptor protein